MGVSSAGRASALQAEGHRFDPDTLHQHFSLNDKIEKGIEKNVHFSVLLIKTD